MRGDREDGLMMFVMNGWVGKGGMGNIMWGIVLGEDRGVCKEWCRC